MKPPRRSRARIPVAWTIAGADPSGGAGLPADLKVFHGLGAYGGCVITAVIAQNTRRVLSLRPVSPALVASQIQALREDLPPAAVKIGMLPNAAVVRAVAAALADLRDVFVVCDPVLGASAGAVFLGPEGRRALVRRLLPRVDLLTPNRPEAEALTGLRVRSGADAMRAAERLLAMGARAVVLKGGHAAGRHCADLFFSAQRRFWLVSPRLRTRAGHGTGCAFSAALAAFVALGKPLEEAAALAKAYVNQGLRLAPGLGGGRGPLFHGGWPRLLHDRPRIAPANAFSW